MTFDLEAAQKAQDEHREHARSCPQCEQVGTANPGETGAKRCDRGKELYTVWDSHRPGPLHGPRLAPDGRILTNAVIDKTHRIGDYAILEVRIDASGDRGGVKWWSKHDTKRIDLYVDNKLVAIDFPSIDEALIAAVAERHCGPMSQAAWFAGKILGLYDEQDKR